VGLASGEDDALPRGEGDLFVGSAEFHFSGEQQGGLLVGVVMENKFCSLLISHWAKVKPSEWMNFPMKPGLPVNFSTVSMSNVFMSACILSIW